jgi:hypothetical protein
MSIAKRIEETLQKIGSGDPEGALVPVCTAVDASAKREYPSLRKNSERYKTFLCDNLWIIGLVGLNGLISKKISLPAHHPDIKPDESGMCNIEDIFYHVIRCGLLHEATIDEYVGFSSKFGYIGTKYIVPNSLPLGFAAAVILSPFNSSEKIGKPINIQIGKANLFVDELWGKKNTIGLLLKQSKL